MTKENRIMNRMNEHLAHYQANYKNDWVGIFLQGSQNYGLDYENSALIQRSLFYHLLKISF